MGTVVPQLCNYNGDRLIPHEGSTFNVQEILPGSFTPVGMKLTARILSPTRKEIMSNWTSRTVGRA